MAFNWSTVFVSPSRIFLVAVLALTLPKTTQSSKELPPSLFLPWTPPKTSPAQ